jgi:hypothetical protein
MSDKKKKAKLRAKAKRREVGAAIETDGHHKREKNKKKR